jgi:CRP-like cAMP-binding protein
MNDEGVTVALTGNLLLDSLSERLHTNILSVGKQVQLPLRTMLHEQGQMPQYAYFLTSGIASLVVTMPEGGTAEVALIGREGLVGVMHILGPTPLPAQCFVQLEAGAIRVRLEDLRTKFQESAELRKAVLEFVQQQTVTTGQIAACNKLHDAESRLARWLLMTRDRADGDTMHITQEFLADMLGTRRTTVTLVAGSLQRRGLIEYRRGKVRILSRETLEHAACDCYRVTKDALEKLYK